MPKLSEHPSAKRTTILLVGDSGAGKTATLSGLLAAGQRLFVADFDNGLDSVRAFLHDASAADHLIYETLVDPIDFDPVNGMPKPKGSPTAFPGFVRLMKSWKDGSEDYGPPESWRPDDWLVIDSLSGLSRAALIYTTWKAGRSGKRRRIQDWGDAIERVEGVLQAVQHLPCNVLITAHLLRLTPDEEPDDDELPPGAGGKRMARLPESMMLRYPAALGQKLPPRIGAYFNIVLQAKRVGHGKAASFVIRTVPDEDVEVKVPVPKGTLPVEVPNTDLWKIVEAVRGAQK